MAFAQVIKLINDRDSDNEKRAGSAKNDMKLSIRGSMLTGHDFKRLLSAGASFRIHGNLHRRSSGSGCNHRILHGLCCPEEV
ncbi:MAG: hypothetical protein ACLUD2_13215 [Clostridium sp.]